MLVLQTEKFGLPPAARKSDTPLPVALAAFASAVSRFMTAVHESRRQQAARTIHGYRHLIDADGNDNGDRFGSMS